MTVSRAEISDRDLFVAAILGSLLVGTVFSGFSVLLTLTSGVPSTAGDTPPLLALFVANTAQHVLSYLPYLLAVLLTMARPMRKALLNGVVLVYVGGILQMYLGTVLADWGGTAWSAEITGLTAVFVPLDTVVAYLAIAAAVWLAYHGGYERLRTAVSQHPLFGAVIKDEASSALTLRRGAIAAGLAALLGVVALVVNGALYDQFSGDVSFEGGWYWTVGVPPTEAPLTWVSQASFLLAVLFVAGPRLTVRDVLKGVAAVVGVQTILRFLVVLGPWIAIQKTAAVPRFGDVASFAAIAVCVWLAFHDGMERIPV